MNYYNKVFSKSMLTARPKAVNFKNMKFRHNWENLVKMYDLRMYYIQNMSMGRSSYKYTYELEKIHNELNYWTLRNMLGRIIFLAMFLYFLGEYLIENKNDTYDWSNVWELKYHMKLYKGLDEGGIEGDEE